MYRRAFGTRATRSIPRTLPLILWYRSNEATCSSFVTRRTSQPRINRQAIGDDTEQWLYDQRERPGNFADGEPTFGSSRDVREFVVSVLERFSPRFRDFSWSFEPFACSVQWVEEPRGKLDRPSSRDKLLEAAVMRYLRESRKGPLRFLDKEAVTINSNGIALGVGRPRKVLPEFSELLRRYQEPSKETGNFSNCTVRVRLTPRIRVLTTDGREFLLSQLSDGEQRLFSLFVDIARKLSVKYGNTLRDERHAAVVLIDEIDVHLHPKWQRMIVPALEKLFPNCQFIATTHSPFVVQSVTERNVQHLDREILGEFTDRGIEEIAVKVMGIEDPEVSVRYLEMLEVAREYFALLESVEELRPGESRQSRAKLGELRETLDALSQPYADNPAYQAFLNLHADLTLGPREAP